MKISILIFLLLLSLSYTYDVNKAVEYANQYCSGDLNSGSGRSRGRQNFPTFDNSGADFVTKCLIAGGFDTSNCLTDENGSISNTNNLSLCLTQNGWKSSTDFPENFKAGYPVLLGTLSFIATEVEEGVVKYSSRSLLSICNDYLGSIIGDSPLYFYLE